MVSLDERGHFRLLQRGAQFVDLRRARQEREFPVQPHSDDCGGPAGRDDQGGHEDIDIDHHAHQALSAFFLVRRAARTSPTASSTRR
jgi:hypothetical protein